jgi:predicted enzyme related to lactoylglutathione lyase
MSNPVVHVELGCRDKTKAAAFYRELFDWSITEAASPLSSDIAPVAGGISGHLTALGHEPHNYVTVYVEVADVAATLAKAATLGGATIVGPIPLPDGRLFAWFKDPDGNALALISPRR